LCFNLSRFVQSNPAEDFKASVQKEDVRLPDLQEFPNHPALHLPSFRYFKKGGFGGLSKERERGLLPGKLLCLRPLRL